MRKQTKLVAIVSAAALLSIGGSLTALAATGWQQENGTWVYYDRNEDKVTETWAKSGDNWYYLDDSGDMAVDALIEDDDNVYYVDANGVMVTNRWVSVANEDYGEENEPEVWWYYFGSNGKAYKRSDSATSDVSLKTIDGKKYTFDTDGKMQYGWVVGGTTSYDDNAWQEANYYFGGENDGALSSGWVQISIVDESWEDAQPGDYYWQDEDQVRWFWFASSGKKVKDTTSKTINGAKYGFDEYGRMIASWYTTATTSDYISLDNQGKEDFTETFLYFSTPEDGARYTKGWFKVEAGYYLNESAYEDLDTNWYYADGKGNLVANEIKTINGKKYLFDSYGRMLPNNRFVRMEAVGSGFSSKQVAQIFGRGQYNTEEKYLAFVEKYEAEIISGEIRAYFFGTGNDGSMKTGKQNVTLDLDTFQFVFETSSSKKGAGLVGIDDGKFYFAGMLAKASSDNKVEVIVLNTDETFVEKLSIGDFVYKYTNDGTEVYKSNGDLNYTSYAVNTGYIYRVVNTSGSLVKSGTKTDGEDYKIYLNSYNIEEIRLYE